MKKRVVRRREGNEGRRILTAFDSGRVRTQSLRSHKDFMFQSSCLQCSYETVFMFGSSTPQSDFNPPDLFTAASYVSSAADPSGLDSSSMIHTCSGSLQLFLRSVSSLQLSSITEEEIELKP
ncbi:hypothetical protein F2P81_019696 [Scophthalmus maximus]|uniref:Uncharacterized protein n=1 Tax=Scophthalmus maximus TaxID=52904 RepID=A0A6A4S7U6_SCOMX|nr:hypothetical protein F2P81_019696 [Scophthalmus maximus]